MKSLKRWLFAVGIVAIAAPILVHIAFNIETPCSALMPTWTSGEVLAYIGALLGAITTIVAVFLTVKNSDEARKEDLRLSVLPCIVVQDLRRVNRKSFFEVMREQGSLDSDEGMTAKEPYTEVKIEKEYTVLERTKTAMGSLAESVREQPAMPRFEDGSVNLRELIRRLAEDVVNAIMDAEADQLCSGGANSRNGYRERNLVTCVG